MFDGFTVEIQPDCEAFLELLTGERKPERVHFAELFLDQEIQDAVALRFGLDDGLDKSDPYYAFRRNIKIHRFLGYDYVRAVVSEGLDFSRTTDIHTADTAQQDQSKGERNWVNESKGPVSSWEEFEKYPWPVPGKINTEAFEWYDRNLPDDMCFTAACHSVFEQLMWLMGVETMSFALIDDPGLVKAVADKAGEVYLAAAKVYAQFDKLRFFFGGDDMGFKTATLISPDDIRRITLPWHKKITQVAHDAGRLNVLHSCGNLEAIMDDLIDDVGLDGKHSFEDVIEPIEDTYRRWGRRVAILGGMDVDLLCRASEDEIRRRVREVLDVCHPGRFALGSGNTVANYIPLDNYLVMLDEGRRYSA